MIKYPEKKISTSLQHTLEGLQKQIDSLPIYTEQVEKGKNLWKSTQRKVSDAKKQVKAQLRELCGKLERCQYCEDSCGDEIEHFRPKDFYPNSVFVWNNYLLSCGPCNGFKLNKFAIFPLKTNRPHHITRMRSDEITPPPSGKPVLINPRFENPLDFLIMDIVDTFWFIPFSTDRNSKEYYRASYTIELLHLNSRDWLVEARKIAFGNFVARLKEYIQLKNNDATQEELQDVLEKIKTMPHQTVWEEMKRQHQHHDNLKDLFAQAPETLHWK